MAFGSLFKSSTVNCKEEEQRIRHEHPLLLHIDETIELAFRDRGGKGRDKEYFTSHRILVENGKGIGSKRKEFRSIPYSEIVMYSVETAGKLDYDTEVHVWCDSLYAKIDFSKSEVDIFEVYQLLNAKIAMAHRKKGSADYIDPTPPNMDKKQSTLGNMMDWLGDNAHQMDAKEAENHFKTSFPILLESEVVELVFKCGRDFTVFTNYRMLRVDVKGFTGKKVEFLTILYGSIGGFSVQTASNIMDRDTELHLHLPKLNDHHIIKQDFRKGKANLWAVQKVLCNHILGEDKNPLPGIDQYNGKGGILKLIDMLEDNLRPIDCGLMESVLRLDPPILQGSEKVELAFQGRKSHITLFTTKRVIFIHKERFLLKKTKYTSLPWDQFVGFSIKTAGHIDFDTELHLYTELHFFPGDDNTPARPEESCLTLDFSKQGVDIMKLKYYLSKRIIDIGKLERGAPLSMDALTEDPNVFGKLARWFSDDQRELDPTALNKEFHSSTKILLDDEKILMAFKGRRDVSIFTNLRVMTIDIEGLTRSKMLYITIPYRSITSYAVQSAGVWDRDSEIFLYTRNRWYLAKHTMDFRVGRTDVMMIQKLLSGFIAGRHTDAKIIFGPKNYTAHKTNMFGGLKNLTLTGGAKEVEVDEMNAKYHFEISMLLEEETVLRAFVEGRDYWLYTNRRFISIDTKGISGKKVRYTSIPYRSMQGFIFETAGSMDRDAELWMYTHIADVAMHNMPRIVHLLHEKQKVLVKHTDIYEMGKLILDHTVFDKTLLKANEDDLVPEIDITY